MCVRVRMLAQKEWGFESAVCVSVSHGRICGKAGRNSTREGPPQLIRMFNHVVERQTWAYMDRRYVDTGIFTQDRIEKPYLQTAWPSRKSPFMGASPNLKDIFLFNNIKCTGSLYISFY